MQTNSTPMAEIRNICFAYITPFHPEKGGIGRVTHTLTLEFQRRGYNVFYLIYPCAITIRHEYDYPAPLEYLPSGDCLSEENIDYYRDYLKRNRIDVVINQSGNFSDSRLWLEAEKEGVPVVSVLHSNPWVAYTHLWSSDVWPLRNASLKEKLKRFARVLLYPRIKRKYKKGRQKQFKMLLPSTSVVCTLSRTFYGELSEIYSGCENKYEAIPNPNSYSNLSIDLNNKKKQILFVGLFGPQKREDRVLAMWKDLFPEFRDWELIMVGSGNPKRMERLRRLASKCERVRFVGMQAALEFQRNASIAVLTSNYEGWGMVLTEAMQCGCVPLAFDSFSSVKDIISDGNDGFLIKPFELTEYTEKLRILMSDDEMRRRMARNAIESVKRFDIEFVADQWESLFGKIQNR